MRKPVTRELIEAFLRAFGERLRKPVRLTLTGGASLLMRGLREQTEDIDLSYSTTEDGAVLEALRVLKDKLDVSVEIAEPGQFIPMPAGRERRLGYVDRYGCTDVFLDDPYAIAISKLHRGHKKDRRDVRLMLDAGLIAVAELEAKVREVASANAPNALNVNADRMLAHLDAARRGEL
ncbi:MAG TPA: DUF6036 family nucleotidyltransferase [Planctomycetota bacterium]|nr:DUF6036 family nucleotidyltransferase [Planctomycetota bacterium]